MAAGFCDTRFYTFHIKKQLMEDLKKELREASLTLAKHTEPPDM